MRAYIRLWGNEYSLDSVDWYRGKEEGISHVSFKDENNILYVIFNKRIAKDLDAETNRGSGDVLYSDFNKTVFWKQK